MSQIRRREREARARLPRELFILVLTVVLLIVLFFRVAYIKAAHGTSYQAAAEQQQLSSTDVTIPALRGAIYDRNGNLLVESTRIYNVILDCQVLIDAPENKQVSTIEALMTTLKLKTEDEIRKYMTKDYHEYRYLKFAPGKGITAAQMEELQLGIDEGHIVGVWFEEDERRTYVNDSLAAHVIGFNGTYGVEQYYDDYLQGTAGRKMVIASTGNSYIEEYIEAENGKNLTLTLDSKVQYLIEEKMAMGVRVTNALRGGAILMNCKTGEIVSMCQVPTYNLNNVTELVGTSDKWNEQNPDKNAPEYYSQVWTSFMINTTYEPGSTFKPMFMAAALNEGVISTTDVITCEGHFQVYDAEVFCAGGEVHGSQIASDIIKNSCNCGMTQISLRFSTNKWLQYQEAYGLGALTGIDMSGEAGDSRTLIYVSGAEAKQLGTGNAMGPFEKATTAFGQGFRLTPIQLVSAMTSVVNGGEYLRPIVVSQITDEFGNIIETHNKEVLRYTVADTVSKEVRSYMRRVVLEGTGVNACVPGYDIGGKTGTGEKIDDAGGYAKNKYVVSFISFTPVEDPQYVLLVILDETNQNSSGHAAHLAGQIWETILPALGMYPDPTINPDAISPSLYDITVSTYGGYLPWADNDDDEDSNSD